MANSTFVGPVISEGGFVGDVTGDIIGDISGDVTGDVTGNLTGNVTGNVTGTVSGGITSGATATEINLTSDVSAYQETIVASGAITLDTGKRVHLLNTTAGAQSNTIPAPSAAQLGVTKIIEVTVDGGNDFVLTCTNVDGSLLGANTTATFADVGDSLILIGGATKWHILAHNGVAFS
jgi:hypothetical protein